MTYEKLNEIKKQIYKQKPTAVFVKIVKGIAVYRTYALRPYERVIYFNVPVADMGDATFELYMDAKLLIRYIQTEEQ